MITYFIAPQQQSQLFKLEKDVTDKQRIYEVKDRHNFIGVVLVK